MNPPVGVTDPVSVASQAYKYHRLHPELVEQLVSIYRTMFPQNTVPDEFYEHVVRKLDDQAVQDQAVQDQAVQDQTVHWTGCSLRSQEHEFRTKDVYGEILGANL